MHSQVVSRTVPERKKGMKRRIRLLMLFVLGFLVWAGMTMMDQMHVIEQQSSRLSDLEQERAEALKLNEQYKMEISKLNDEEYFEQKLRQNLHMTKQGEILFIPVE